MGEGRDVGADVARADLERRFDPEVEMQVAEDRFGAVLDPEEIRCDVAECPVAEVPAERREPVGAAENLGIVGPPHPLVGRREQNVVVDDGGEAGRGAHHCDEAADEQRDAATSP